tara:strand:- start:35 stop:376 length:342 start_codon:yes stop_codon:yes gene_type:complete
MASKPDQATDNPGIEEEVGSPKKAPATKKKASTKRKPATAKSKRRRPSAKPLAPPPPPLTLEELKEQGIQAKQEIVSAVVEPAVEVVGSLSQTIRDTISGAFAGLLSRKRRND